MAGLGQKNLPLLKAKDDLGSRQKCHYGGVPQKKLAPH